MRDLFDPTQSAPFPEKQSTEDYPTIVGNALKMGFESVDPTPYMNLKFMQAGAPGKFIAHQDLPYGTKSALEIGGDTTGTELEYVNELKAEAQQRAAVVNSMPDTFLAHATNAISNVLGTALSPVGILSGEVGGLALRGAGYIAPKIIPAISARFTPYAIPTSILSKVGSLTAERPVLSNLASKGALLAGKGIVSGTTAMAALTPFQYGNESILGDKTSFYGDLWENLKTGFYWGAGTGFAAPFVGYGARKIVGGMVGAFDKKVVGTPQDSADALKLAQDQLATGNKVDVSPMIDQTLYSSAQNVSDLDVINANRENDIFSQRIKQITSTLDESQKIKDKEDLSTLGVTRKLAEIVRKEPQDRTNFEKKYRENMLSIPYHNTLLESHMADFEERTVEQQNMLSNATNLDHEKNSIQELVSTYEKEKYDALNYVDIRKGNDNYISMRNNVLSLLKDSDKKIEFMKSRLNEIDQFQRKPRLLQRANDINNLKLERDKLQSYSDKNQGIINLRKLSKPLTQDRIYEGMKKSVDTTNEMDYSQPTQKRYQDKYADTEFEESKEPEDIESIKKEFGDLEPDEELSEIEDEVKEHSGHIKTLFQAIKNTLSCLNGESSDA